ncbi:MAG: hypothetical protein ACK4KT_07495 [Thermaurantimonas sp.]
MNPLENLVNKLKIKVIEVTNLCNSLKEENIRMNAEIIRLRKRLTELQSQNAELIEQQSNLQNDLDRGEKLFSIQAKSKINELVREIDKCLALIEQ